MSERVSFPNMKSGRGFFENAFGFGLRQIGPGKRDNKIQLPSTLQHVSSASQDAVDFTERAEAIEIHRRQRSTLSEQFLIGHDFPQPQAREHHITKVPNPKTNSAHGCRFRFRAASCADLIQPSPESV